MADIPAGTGLGSSGSFTTALLKALHAHKQEPRPPARAGRAGLPHRDRPARRADRQAGPVHRRLRRPHLLPVPARRPRRGLAAASSTPRRSTTSRTTCCCSSPATAAPPARILKEQDDKSRTSDQEMVDNLHFVKELGYQSQEALEAGDLHALRRADERPLGAQEAALRRHEQRRHRRAGTSSRMENGALGGKLIGAGGGGFLMFYAEDKTRLRHAMREAGPARGALPLRLRGHEGRDPVTRRTSTDMSAVAILAGGLATRLRPLTETIPKALVEVAGRPFIDHQLALLRRNGIRRVVMCLGLPAASRCEAHVRRRRALRHGARATPSTATSCMGTGGALAPRRAAARRRLLGHVRRLVPGHRLPRRARRTSTRSGARRA